MLIVLYLRCKARVAPPVDEFDNELSFWDEFLPLSRQLGVEVEVELEISLVYLVIIDREVYETMNSQRKAM